MNATIFIVDDDADVRRALGLVAEAAGYAVQAFASAEDFLEVYDGTKHGCLVLDLRLTGMSGLELQHALADKGLHVPIIFVSGHGQICDSVRALKAGAVDFLEKPYSAEVLLSRIDVALREDERNRLQLEEQFAVRQLVAKLTPREREVVELLVNSLGRLSSRQIAIDLGISVRTVEHHRGSAMTKLKVATVSELLVLWGRATFANSAAAPSTPEQDSGAR